MYAIPREHHSTRVRYYGGWHDACTQPCGCSTAKEKAMRHKKMGMVLLMASAVFLGAQDPPGRVGRLNYREGPVSYLPPVSMIGWTPTSTGRSPSATTSGWE